MSIMNASFTLMRSDFQLDVAFTLPTTGVTALFGNSGCGKTTLLRCIAGLEKADQGVFIIDDEVWQDHNHFLPTHKRGVGYVFQESLLFEHLDGTDNLRYGERRTPPSAQKIPFDEVVELLNLSPLLQRLPSQLSGGQRQRIAIGRALLSNPRLLLMDEPLASLDLQSKADILPYLDRLHEQLQIPILYVSHSPDEVVRIADRMLLLDEGRILASGPVNELMTRTDLPIAHLEQASAVVSGQVAEHDGHYHLSTIKLSGGYVSVSLLDRAIGQTVRVRILARDVSLAKEPAQHSSITNAFPVCIAEISSTLDPAKVLVKLDMKGEHLLSQITAKSASNLKLAVGDIIYAQVKSVALMR